MRAFFTQQQLGAGAQQHAAVRDGMEVIAGRVLGDQALEQRPAINPFAVVISIRRERTTVHFRRRGEGRRAPPSP